MSVLTFLMIKIVPEYVKIFEEFEVELPSHHAAGIAVIEFLSCSTWRSPTIMALLLSDRHRDFGICYLCDVPSFADWLTDYFAVAEPPTCCEFWPLLPSSDSRYRMSFIAWPGCIHHRRFGANLCPLPRQWTLGRLARCALQDPSCKRRRSSTAKGGRANR